MKILFVENSQLTPFSSLAHECGAEYIVDKDLKDLDEVFGKQSVDVIVTSPEIENVDKYLSFGKPLVVCRENLSSLFPYFQITPFADMRYSALMDDLEDRYDVGLFADRIPLDQETLLILTHVGKEPLGWNGEFSITYDAQLEDRQSTPAGITMYNRFANSVVKRIHIARGTTVSLSLSKTFLTPLWATCQTLSNIIAGCFPLVDREIYLSLQQVLKSENIFGSREELAHKIYQWLRDKENRERSVASMADFIKSKHSSAEVAQSLMEFIRRL